MSRRKVNKFIATSAVTRPEKYEISQLVITSFTSAHGNYKSIAWNHFGELKTKSIPKESNKDIVPTPCSSSSSDVHVGPHETTLLLDSQRFYCRPCLEREQARYAKSDKATPGHISKVKNYSKQTATTTLCDHLFNTHGIQSSQGSKMRQSEISFTGKSQADNLLRLSMNLIVTLPSGTL